MVEDRDTILEHTGKIQELQNEINCMNDSRDFQDAESVRSGPSHVASQLVSFPPHPVPGGMLSRSIGMPSRKDGPPSIWDTHGMSGNVDVSSEHTPINLPTKNMSFQQEHDATITASEDLNLPRRSRASSSSQQTAASRVPTLLKLGSLGTRFTKVSAVYDPVASRSSIKETCADVDRGTFVSSLFGSVSKRKRDRDQNVVQTFRDRQNLHTILERQAELALRGEKLAQQRLCEAETDVEVKQCEKRKSDIALFEINQEFESQ